MLANQLTLGALAEIAGATLQGDAATPVLRLSALEEAGPGHLSYFDGRQRGDLLRDSPAAGVLVDWREFAFAPGAALLRCDAPHRAFLTIAAVLWNGEALPPARIDPTAVVEPSAILGRGAYVGPRAVIAAGAVIGEGVAIHAGAMVGAMARIGAATSIGANCAIAGGVEIGANCTLLPGVVIGFAYRPGSAGSNDDQAPATGGVRIGDKVQIGSNCVIEPGENRSTRIAAAARIGSGCVIGHDSRIGEGAIIGGACGLAGEVEIGRHAVLFGQVGVSSRARVGDFATVLAKSGVSRDVPDRCVFAGIPARPRKNWQLATNALYHLPDLRPRVAALEATIAELQAALSATGILPAAAPLKPAASGPAHRQPA